MPTIALSPPRADEDAQYSRLRPHARRLHRQERVRANLQVSIARPPAARGARFTCCLRAARSCKTTSVVIAPSLRAPSRHFGPVLERPGSCRHPDQSRRPGSALHRRFTDVAGNRGILYPAWRLRAGYLIGKTGARSIKVPCRIHADRATTSGLLTRRCARASHRASPDFSRRRPSRIIDRSARI